MADDSVTVVWTSPHLALLSQSPRSPGVHAPRYCTVAGCREDPSPHRRVLVPGAHSDEQA